MQAAPRAALLCRHAGCQRPAVLFAADFSPPGRDSTAQLESRREPTAFYLESRRAFDDTAFVLCFV